MVTWRNPQQNQEFPRGNNPVGDRSILAAALFFANARRVAAAGSNAPV